MNEKYGFELIPICRVWGLPVDATIEEWRSRCSGFSCINDGKAYGCKHRNGFECSNEELLLMFEKEDLSKIKDKEHR